MTHAARWIFALTLIAGLVTAPAAGGADDTPIGIEIEIAPSVLNLASSGVWVTVHADIALADVDVDDDVSVTLDGVPVVVVKADSHGDLVAKFDLDAVKDILFAPSTVDLELTGFKKDGTPFSGEDTIRVVDIKGGR